MRPARVAAVVLGVAERREQARDRVGVVAALTREAERVREPVHGFVVRAHRVGAFAGANRELDRIALPTFAAAARWCASSAENRSTSSW